MKPVIAHQEKGREGTRVVIKRIGADDHGVDYPGVFSTNFLLLSLKPSVRVSSNTLIPVCACLYLWCLAASYM